jgi:hypothetical protein
MQTCMVTISITLEAYEAVAATLPEGDVAQVPQIDERGGVRFLVDRKTLDWLTAPRPRHSCAPRYGSMQSPDGRLK